MPLTYRPGGMIPGGYPFQDPRTGRKFDGFDAGGGGDQIARIVKYRAANPRIFPEPEWSDPQFVAQQLLDYQIQRLGGDRRFFTEVGVRSTPAARAAERKAAAEPPKVIGKCSCGGDLDPVYCKTCGGKRVVGTKCKSCGKVVGR